MNFTIIGCGRVGAQLAFNLFQRGHKVTIIDKDETAFTNLPAEFYGRTIEGEGTYWDVLRRAGIEQADGVAVVTNSDSLNAVIGHIAQSHFKVKNVVVRNFDPIWRTMIDSFKLPVISSSSWGAQRIEELLLNPNMQLAFVSGNGEMGVYELIIPDDLSDRPLTTILPNRECAIVGLIRDGKAILPDLQDTIKKGDRILVSATKQGADAVRQHLRPSQEIKT